MIIRPWSHDRSQRNAQNCRFVSKSPPFHPAQPYPWSWATLDASAAPMSRAICAWFSYKEDEWMIDLLYRGILLLTCKQRRQKHNTRAQRSDRVWQVFRRVISLGQSTAGRPHHPRMDNAQRHRTRHWHWHRRPARRTCTDNPLWKRRRKKTLGIHNTDRYIYWVAPAMLSVGLGTSSIQLKLYSPLLGRRNSTLMARERLINAKLGRSFQPELNISTNS